MIATFASIVADNDGWDGHMGSGGGWWMLIWGTLMMSGLVIFATWALRTTTKPARGDGSSDPLDPARRILAERFARGEISADEYRESIDHLR